MNLPLILVTNRMTERGNTSLDQQAMIAAALLSLLECRNRSLGDRYKKSQSSPWLLEGRKTPPPAIASPREGVCFSLSSISEKFAFRCDAKSGLAKRRMSRVESSTATAFHAQSSVVPRSRVMAKQQNGLDVGGQKTAIAISFLLKSH
jgi:hypothetical protein